MDNDLRTNAMNDLLDAERHFRQQAENALRELRAVLTELAQRTAGLQIEEARRTDPSAPEHWGPEHWRKFFTSLPFQAGYGWNDHLLVELEQLRGENQAFKEKLASLPAQTPAAPHPMPKAVQSPAASSPARPGAPALPQSTDIPAVTEINPQGCSLAHLDLLRDLRALQLPAVLPARFEGHFPKAGLSQADWERQVRRKLYTLYLLSLGMDIRLEMDVLVSQVEGISAGTGGLRRVYDSMVQKNLASGEVLGMSAPNTSLAMLQLTEDGRQLCQILEWGVAESERQRLNRLHQGIQNSQHTLAVLIFAMHARLRGYQVCVLPSLEGAQTNAVPDVSVTRNLPDQKPETLYAEVELSTKELDAKWRNQVSLQGRVALCARNAKRRARLVGDCKLKNLPGMATDLETLIACKVPEITHHTPLWAEEW